MKKLVLTIVALVAVATTSFAQYFTTYKSCSPVTYSAPIVMSSVPIVSDNISCSTNFKTTTISGYSRSNGTYVQPHVRTMPNSVNWDNYSTKGNSNPYTGSKGFRAKDYSSGAYNYGRGHTIHTGSRGGQYYNNSKGNRIYVPKCSMW